MFFLGWEEGDGSMFFFVENAAAFWFHYDSLSPFQYGIFTTSIISLSSSISGNI